ncbi:unnamed protein product [Peronospora belbahrii]|nr:unnamed protein product [Peronospora belbahrii]CAH0515790.1 unnamed protein product [Peronospora belbahrii]
MASNLAIDLAEEVPSFHVPVFNYETLTTGNTPYKVLDALKKDGIISFSNVPSYSQIRDSYHNMAAACAVSAQDANPNFLHHKTLTDGAKRYVISATSGQDANAAAITTDTTCPGYKDIYTQFSSLLEMVVLSVGTTLDATDFTMKDSYGQTVSSHQLMTDAVRLDHFHAYETPSSKERTSVSASSSTNTSASTANDFALELHENDGMFIVFSTPTYYKVNGDGLNQTFKSVLPSGKDGLESGLLIMTHDSQIVQPILKPDHVTLMMGSNFNKWMYSSMHMPAVKHVLRLPVIDMMPTQRLLRTWFGKTTLLPSYQRLLGQMDIETHASASANYVRKLHESNGQLLGSSSRQLQMNSDCQYVQCTSVPCQISCNSFDYNVRITNCYYRCQCSTQFYPGFSCNPGSFSSGYCAKECFR